MSTDQFEHGNLKFTQTGYRQTLKFLKGIYNLRQDLLFGFAEALHARLKQLPKKDQNYNSIHDIVVRRDLGHYVPQRLEIPGLPATVGRQYVSDVDLWDVAPELFRGKDRALCKPRRSAFANAKASEKSLTLGYTVAFITMDEETLTLGWEVPESNHSSDAAWAHPITQMVMGEYLGSKYNWKRGEGGSIKFYSDTHDGDGVTFDREKAFGNATPKVRQGRSSDNQSSTTNTSRMRY